MSTRAESEPAVSGEEYNPGPADRAAAGRDRDPAARRRRARSRCCSSGARRRRASWAAYGSSPAAPSTPHEGDGDEAHRAAAIRELREEAAIELDDPGALVKFSRWITPAQVQIRFDTHFFLAPLPRRAGAGGRRRGGASTSAGSRPRRRSKRTPRSEIVLVFPTIKHLEQLSAFAIGRRAARLRARARRAAGRAEGGARGRGRARPAAGRPRLLSARRVRIPAARRSRA